VTGWPVLLLQVCDGSRCNTTGMVYSHTLHD